MSNIMSTTLRFRGQPVGGFQILSSALAVGRRDRQAIAKLQRGTFIKRNTHYAYPCIMLQTSDSTPIDTSAMYRSCLVTCDAEAGSDASWWFTAFVNEFAGELRVSLSLEHEAPLYVGALSN